MSHLDDELKHALAQPENSPTAGGTSEAGSQERLQESDPKRKEATALRAKVTRKRSIGLLVGLLLMGGAILTVVFTGIDNAAVYSKGVDQLLSEKDRLKSRNVRVLGTLVKGTLVRRNEPCEYRFKLTKGAKELQVHYPQCIIPDTFRDIPGTDVEVTAEGKLQSDGTFLAHQIMAKCPSKYDMKQKSNSGYGAPHMMGPES